MLHETLFSMLNILYIYINTFRGMCAVSSVAGFFPCSSFILCFSAMFLRYFLNYFEVVPFAPVTAGITFVCTFPCVVFLLWGLNIVRSSQNLSLSHFCLLF
jgi:amino acid transporter